MNDQWQEDWTCLECGSENPDSNYQCSECETAKPIECDTCGELMIPWRDTPKSRLEKWTCRHCYFEDAGHPSDNVDRDEGCDR